MPISIRSARTAYSLLESLDTRDRVSAVRSGASPDFDSHWTYREAHMHILQPPAGQLADVQTGKMFCQPFTKIMRHACAKLVTSRMGCDLSLK